MGPPPFGGPPSRGGPPHPEDGEDCPGECPMTYARARCALGSVSRCGVRGWTADGQRDAGRAGDRFHSVDLPHSGGTHHPGQGLGGTAGESVPTATGLNGLSRASLFHGRPPSAVEADDPSLAYQIKLNAHSTKSNG